uniref:AAA domain-containing protein n=1 Tax=Candidatus Kentrum sp. FM TaxID=2126340 RepID=A0A450S7S9_9GAMM|nr:MAG: AAA domain-containing protein [Candidatus Kentron sp. FM]VFJ50206.1 MAG: AAA domain-containing protein [Candidatus Kentron sp. FM]VFK08534.1 MAG: AAA domain-containing protein [Candidatus Kentron sp. FM]
MFFTAEQIMKSISKLKEEVHPFFGITFLACKRYELPIGEQTDFPMDTNTKKFMELHHKIDWNSAYFYQPFGSRNKKKEWVGSDYPSSGLQAINTRTFPKAFSHDSNTGLWGWSNDYIEVLRRQLPEKEKEPIPISVFHLAVWIYKDKDWPDDTTADSVVNSFLEDFHITEEETKHLFSTSLPSGLSAQELFGERVVSWEELRGQLSPPPDAEPEREGTLAFLQTKGIGPADELTLEPSKRLTLITGDNGLGKTFLLECAWWVLTGLWAGRAAFPSSERSAGKARIIFRIEGRSPIPGDETTIPFDWQSLSWPHPEKRPIIPGLVIYARVDGSFAVWDSARAAPLAGGKSVDNTAVYTASDVWDGLPGKIEGLIRDWVRWQANPGKHPYDTLVAVLERLSPPDLGPIRPGEPVRIPDDPREIPTIEHRYGKIPIVDASAGVRRIMTLAYLVVWAWNEHGIVAAQRRSEPQRRIVVLVDEMEAHLHPRWQRTVLPALMRAGGMLPSKPDIQFLVATHSPLVMASAETVFDGDLDSLVHFSLDEKTGKVGLDDIDFVRFGEVSEWLTSPVFGLRHARSREAESAIEAAKALQKQDHPPVAQDVEKVSSRLMESLAPDDRFWPRWIAFAEKYGVEL